MEEFIITPKNINREYAFITWYKIINFYKFERYF